MHDCTGFLFYSDCSIRVSQFFMQNMISCICSTFGKANPVIEYNFQSVVTSFVSIRSTYYIDYDDDD